MTLFSISTFTLFCRRLWDTATFFREKVDYFIFALLFIYAQFLRLDFDWRRLPRYFKEQCLGNAEISARCRRKAELADGRRQRWRITQLGARRCDDKCRDMQSLVAQAVDSP